MQDDNQNELKPGQAYSPQPAEAHTEVAGQNTYAQTPVEAPQSPQAPTTPRIPAQPPAQPQGPVDAPEEDYASGEEQESDVPTAETALLTWNAPEFTFVNKPGGWFMLLALFFGALIVLAIFTKQWLSIGLFAIMGIALAIYANRKPRTLNYTITTHGVHVGEKAYAFDNFSAFYEVSDYGQRVFELVPTKRLGTLVSLPVQSDQERTIEQLMGSVLPKVPAKNDAIDRLFRYLRF